MGTILKAFLGLSVSLYFVIASVAFGQTKPTRNVWDGVYTSAQADRGDKLFAASCAMCHGANMSGGGGVPGLIGPELLVIWGNKPAYALFDTIQATMPADAPGSLRPQQYADILSAIFRANAFPASPDKELSPERAALEDILLASQK